MTTTTKTVSIIAAAIVVGGAALLLTGSPANVNPPNILCAGAAHYESPYLRPPVDILSTNGGSDGQTWIINVGTNTPQMIIGGDVAAACASNVPALLTPYQTGVWCLVNGTIQPCGVWYPLIDVGQAWSNLWGTPHLMILTNAGEVSAR